LECGRRGLTKREREGEKAKAWRREDRRRRGMENGGKVASWAKGIDALALSN